LRLDSLLDAALLTRYENTCRSDEHRSADWIDGQMTKIAAALDQMENRLTNLEGGLPIIIAGQCVGAVGVGAGTGAQDVEVGRAALAAIGAKDQKP
jgi:uncharacterized protein GlcG (DUF336 family)